MTNFFDLSDGKSAATGEKEFSNQIEPIPDKTDVEVICEAAKWGEWEGTRNIKLTWGVLKPSEYSNRKVFQTLNIFHADAKKADKAKRMLAAIDANAKGMLASLNKEPTDDDLERALVNRPPMLLKLGVYNERNYVMAVSPRGSSAPSKPAPKTDDDIDI